VGEAGELADIMDDLRAKRMDLMNAQSTVTDGVDVQMKMTPVTSTTTDLTSMIKKKVTTTTSTTVTAVQNEGNTPKKQRLV
jgi:NADH dehydrogenase FAD-containing subunit